MTLSADDVACITEFFNFVDADGTGYITAEEIETACQVDTDGDGSITRSEVVESARPWIEAFTAQDLDQDQRISLAELLEYNASSV